VIEPRRLNIEVGCSPGTRLSDVDGQDLHVVAGRPHGYRREHDWGVITVWEPPGRLGYLWHLRRDRADVTEVQIIFERHGDGTLVKIEHSGWERLGTGSAVA
jgi:uncharacterized protein YndB with AHSA1/START domain